jgi:hypothetical protein
MRTTSRTTPIRLATLLALVALAVLAPGTGPTRGAAATRADAALATPTAADAIASVTEADGTLSFDVAEDGTRFTWGGDPALASGMPDRDTPYITQGYVYPAGTLDGSNGVNPDGSPEFPDEVLGQWTCWGWWVGAGKPGETAPWITTHLFNFGGAWGEATLVSEGYSLDDVGVPLPRAVVGGTGPFAGVTGVQLETVLGHNASEGVDFHYEVRRAGS